jgi:ubiquinone/menaquinone biosynthesis C-methylase UbiE
MSIDILKELNVEGLRANFLKYTRKAYQMLPNIEKPYILDVGCGTGIPTIELAYLSDGDIIGIDIDQNALNELNTKIKKRGFSNRLKTKLCSFMENDFIDNSFDIIWDEGVIHLLDLEKTLKECQRVLKTNGFLIMNETINWIKDKFDTFYNFGFKLKDYFILPENSWWTEYYSSLENTLKNLRVKYKNSKNLIIIKQYENEIKIVKKNPKKFDCGFYIMQKLK